MILTPLYMSVAWTLIASYQLLTQTAVENVVPYVNIILPSLGAWIMYKLDVVVFVYAFAWVFVLSSVIPSIMLGKERSVLVQFIVCLTMTFTAFMANDILVFYGSNSIDQLLSLNIWLYNPYVSAFYLLLPYMLMVMIDVRSRRRCKILSKNTTNINTVRCPECGILYNTSSTPCPNCRGTQQDINNSDSTIS